jgi:hypothetical protein
MTNDVEITIDPGNTTVFKGEHLIVSVTISNEGQADLRLAKQDKLYRTQATFNVEIVEGQPISQTAMAPPPGVLHDNDYEVLAPGHKSVDEVVFERDVYWSIAEPGSMDITVRLAMTGPYMPEKPYFTSNKVRIQVLDIPEKERDGFRRVLLKRVKQDGKQYIDKVLVGEADIPGQKNPVTVALYESEIGTIWRTKRLENIAPSSQIEMQVGEKENIHILATGSDGRQVYCRLSRGCEQVEQVIEFNHGENRMLKKLADGKVVLERFGSALNDQESGR